MSIRFKPIGTIYTPFKTTEGMPMQAKGVLGEKGQIAVNKDLAPGLTDLDHFFAYSIDLSFP